MRARRLLLAAAAAVLVVALVPPLDGRPLALHMASHVLLGDVAPLLVGAALALRVPWPAGLGLWAVSRGLWHYPAVFDAAARNPWLHALEHLSLFAGGLALWSVVLRHALPAARIALVVGYQLGGTVLGLVLLWATPALYATGGGLTQQRVAAAVMMVTGTVLALGLLTWLLLGVLREDERGYAEETGVPRPIRG